MRKRAPSAHVTVVNKQSSHKKYFVEENRDTNAILRELRQRNIIYTAGPAKVKPAKADRPTDRPAKSTKPAIPVQSKVKQKSKWDQNQNAPYAKHDKEYRRERPNHSKGGAR